MLIQYLDILPFANIPYDDLFIQPWRQDVFAIRRPFEISYLTRVSSKGEPRAPHQSLLIRGDGHEVLPHLPDYDRTVIRARGHIPGVGGVFNCSDIVCVFGERELECNDNLWFEYLVLPHFSISIELIVLVSEDLVRAPSDNLVDEGVEVDGQDPLLLPMPDVLRMVCLHCRQIFIIYYS